MPEQIARIDIETFDAAYHIIGGGQEGDKTVVHTKEQADHSMPYLVAVVLLDGQVTPEQFRQERIERRDVQNLLRKVAVRPVDAYSRQFPDQMPCRLTITLADGRALLKEKQDYEGYHTRPMSWEAIVRKFNELGAPHADASLRAAIVQAVADLETIPVAELTGLLSAARRSRPTGEETGKRAFAGV
jgi:2-methylcitrate dehydratase